MSSSRLRALRAEDAEQVAALFVECYGGARLVDPEEIRSWLGNPELEPDWLRVLEEDGAILGYGDIWPKGPVLDLDAATRDRWEPFFEWAEAEARERGLERVRVQIPHAHPLAAFAEARGYAPWRSSLRMRIELDEAPSVPPFPDGVVVRAYRDENQTTLIDFVNDAFAEDPFHQDIGESNFRHFYLGARGFDPALFFLAWAGDELAGCSLTYLQQGSDEELGWVGTLGVRANWRRRGLGAALLRHSFAELYARGRRRVGLGVDAQNVTGALRLYERAGMHVVTRSDNWQRGV
jgi:ribosomal protein S18 acetylase RimI-like enzyme